MTKQVTKKKVAKKKVAKKVTKKVEIEDGKKFLTNEEMLKIEVAQKNKSIKELELLAMKQKKKIIDLEFEKEQTLKQNEYRALKDKEKDFIGFLKKKYNILNDHFGYDHISGEIKDE